MKILELFAPYGPGWLGGVLLALILFYFGRQFLEEFRKQMEGRIAAQMERSNSLMEAMKTLMESVATSNEVLHADLANSQARSQGMAAKVDHICDRVDLLYDKEASN